MKIWDSFVRLSHWLLVILLISAYLSANYGDIEMVWHTWNGIAIIVVTLSRLIWGLVGSSSARLSHFMRLPWHALRYLLDLLKGSAKQYAGHNPAGGWMALALWLVLIGQGLAGLFSSDDIIVEGPLAHLVSSDAVEWMTRIHHQLFDLLLILIGLHIAAVLFHQFIKKEKLIQAMFSGNKPASQFAVKRPELIFKPLSLALLIVALVAIVVIGLINTFG